jgi:hypothetical protein
MNDFTKEELEWIYGKMPTYFRDQEDPKMYPLVKNIVSRTFQSLSTQKGFALYCNQIVFGNFLCPCLSKIQEDINDNR